VCSVSCGETSGLFFPPCFAEHKASCNIFVQLNESQTLYHTAQSVLVSLQYCFAIIQFTLRLLQSPVVSCVCLAEMHFYLSDFNLPNSISVSSGNVLSTLSAHVVTHFSKAFWFSDVWQSKLHFSKSR